MNKSDTHQSQVRSVLSKYKIHPKNRLGQHFLMEHNVLAAIAEACRLTPNDYVVEIGAGWGALTWYLAKKARGVLAIEVDRDLAPVLQEMLAGQDNVRFLFADVMQIDLEEELQKSFGLADEFSFQVCANLPYYITSPIIFRLLESTSRMSSAVLMMQKEVANRLLASPGGKDYGLATVMVGYHARVEMVRTVSPNCFYPRPEVESAVVRLIPWRPRPWSIRDEAAFKSLVRAAFQKRRKTMRRIMTDFFGIKKEQAAIKLQALGIEPDRRPETLTIEEFGRIADGFPE